LPVEQRRLLESTLGGEMVKTFEQHLATNQSDWSAFMTASEPEKNVPSAWTSTDGESSEKDSGLTNRSRCWGPTAHSRQAVPTGSTHAGRGGICGSRVRC
jgi:hypothetical protein